MILFKHKARNEMSFLRATLKKKKEKHENNEKSEEPTERPSTGKKYALSIFLLYALFSRNQTIFAQHQCSYFFIVSA